MKIEFMVRIKDLVDAHRTNDEQCIEAMTAVLEKWKLLHSPCRMN